MAGPNFPPMDECITETTPPPSPSTTTLTTTTTVCYTPSCDKNGHLENTTSVCGQCVCDNGWAGPGYLCGPDDDADGWSDIPLNCTEPRYQCIKSKT